MNTALKYGSLVCIVVSVYFGIAMIPRYFGNKNFSSALLPFYTESNVEILAAETDMIEAKALADKIHGQNAYIPETYDIFAIDAFQNGDYSKFIKEKMKSIALQKYNMEAYEKYLAFVAKGLNIAVEMQEAEDVRILLNGAEQAREMLVEVEKNTNSLAYKTRDIPNFTLSEWAQEFLEQIK